MAFGKRRTTAFGSARVEAAAGIAGQVVNRGNYSTDYSVAQAMTVPPLARALNLLVSLIAGLDLVTYTALWDPTEREYVDTPVPGETWMTRPQPGTTRQFFYGSIVADLFWHGRAFAAVTSRYGSGFPASFQWLPHANINTPDQTGPFWYGPSEQILFNGFPLDPANVVQFVSPTPGVIATGSRVIDIALRLDSAAQRFASNEIAAGYLQVQPGGEPMSGDQLADLASDWATARSTNAIGALNELVRYVEFSADPSKLQLTEGRQYAALELSRVAQIPAWLLGIGIPGMTYQNAQDAMRQLYVLGARPIMTTIEETLSLDTVLPRGRFVRFDVDELLHDVNMAEETDPAPNNTEVPT